MNQRHNIDWITIRKQKQHLINKCNKSENRNLINHMYKVGDKVLLKNACKTKFSQDSCLGSYIITAVRSNVTVRYCVGKFTDTFKLWPIMGQYGIQSGRTDKVWSLIK